jgi:hypothetical protein
LELEDRGRLRCLRGQPTLEGLVEALDLPAGRRVVRPRVLLSHPEADQFGFEAVAAALAARESGGEDHAVVGERGGRNTVRFRGFLELGDDDATIDAAVGSDPQREPGVVVKPAEDLGVAAIDEAVVGEVGLPRLIRQLRREAHIRRPRTLVGLRRHEPGAAQMAKDRGRRHAHAALGEVPADRLGAGVVARGDQSTAQLDDQRDDLLWRRSRRPLRATRSRLKRGVALVSVAGHEP